MLGVKKEVKRLTDEILDSLSGIVDGNTVASSDKQYRNFYFPKNMSELEQLYTDLLVDKKTLSISPREPPDEVTVEVGGRQCKLCMYVQYSQLDEKEKLMRLDADDMDKSRKKSVKKDNRIKITLLKQIYISLDFCKTVEELKYCFAGGNPKVLRLTKFDGEQWFELAKQSLGFPCKLSRKIIKMLKDIHDGKEAQKEKEKKMENDRMEIEKKEVQETQENLTTI
jgi:hypothetical protein